MQCEMLEDLMDDLQPSMVLSQQSGSCKISARTIRRSEPYSVAVIKFPVALETIGNLGMYELRIDFDLVSRIAFMSDSSYRCAAW